MNIYWRGDIDEENAWEVLRFVEGFARSLGFPYLKYYDRGYSIKVSYVTEDREERSSVYVKDSDLTYIDCDSDKPVRSERRGVYIQIPLRADFDIYVFRTDKGRWILEGMCKMGFASEDEPDAIYAHIIAVALLKTIQDTWIPSLEIVDEGGVYTKTNMLFDYNSLLKAYIPFRFKSEEIF